MIGNVASGDSNLYIPPIIEFNLTNVIEYIPILLGTYMTYSVEYYQKRIGNWLSIFFNLKSMFPFPLEAMNFL